LPCCIAVSYVAFTFFLLSSDGPPGGKSQQGINVEEGNNHDEGDSSNNNGDGTSIESRITPVFSYFETCSNDATRDSIVQYMPEQNSPS
jgi:hypothetical protein